MHTLIGLTGAGLLAVAGAVSAAPAPNLAVNFVHPEKYTDAGYTSPLPGDRGRAEVAQDIEKHLQKLAARLPPEWLLTIDVLDIDLAGSFEPFRFPAGADVRIVRSISYPKIKLRYTLTRNDQPVAGAEEQLSNLNFLTPHNRYGSSDRLRYEKVMLDEWFDNRIVKR